MKQDAAPGVDIVSPMKLTYLDSLVNAYRHRPTQQRASELAHAVPDLISALRACWAEDGRSFAHIRQLRSQRDRLAKATVAHIAAQEATQQHALGCVTCRSGDECEKRTELKEAQRDTWVALCNALDEWLEDGGAT